MNLFKKVIATIALSTMLIANVASVSAYSSDSVDAANTLAGLGIINDHSSDTAAYNLDQNVLRQEIAAVTMGVAGLDKKTSCDNLFDDVSMTTPNTWACYVVETLRDADMIAANANFNPESNITKAEALGMLVKAAFGDDYSYDASLSSSWQEQLVAFSSENGVVEAFTDYNTPATRGWVFEVAVSSMDAAALVGEDDDILCQLLGTCDPTDPTDPTDPVDPVVTDGELMVELSPESPTNGVVAAGTPRTAIMAFDVTAGAADVTLDEARLDYTGLSDYANIDNVKFYINNTKVSKGTDGKDFNDKYIEISFENGTVVKAGSTETVFVTAEVQDDTTNSSHQITLTELSADAEVQMMPIPSMHFSVVSATNVAELELDIDEVTGSDITVGEETKLADFELEEKNDNEDVVVKSLTFQLDGSMDHQDDLSDIVLYADGEMVASDLMVNSDEEVVVDLDYTIEADSKVNFELYVVVTGSVTETLSATLEEIYAVGAETGINANETAGGDEEGDSVAAERTIEGSEINVAFDKSDVDEAKPDAEEVLVGTLVLSTDGEYTMTTIQVEVDTDGGADVQDIIQKLELDGKSADSDDGNLNSDVGIYYFEDISLNNETLELPLTFDVVDNVALDGETLTFTTTIVEVEDEENDETYTALTTPSLNDILSTNALDDNTIDIATANATFTSTNVNDKLVVLGNGVEVVAYKGKLNVGDADSINISDFNLLIDTNDSGEDLDDLIDSATLNIGGQTFDADIDADSVDFDTNLDVEAGADNVSILVTLVLKDNDGVSNNDELVLLVDDVALANDVEDSDGNSLGANLNTTTINDNLALVELLDRGTFAFTLKNDVDTDDNLENTVLAGSEDVVLAELEVEAEYEDMKVKELVFTISGQDSSSTLDEVRLVSDSATTVATAQSIIFDGVDTVITFEDDFVISEDSNVLDLELVADLNLITGVGGVTSAVAQDLVVEYTSIEVKGDSSNDDIVGGDLTELDEGAETVAVVPSIVTPSLEVSLNTSTTPRIAIYSNSGDNTDSNEESIDSEIETIVFSTLGTTDGDASLTFQLVNEDDSTDIVNGNLVGTTLTFDLTGMADPDNYTVENGKTNVYKIVITGATTDEDTLSLTLPRDGVVYTSDGTPGYVVDLMDEIDFGTRSY